ncbi:hemin-binding protein [Mycobacterium sp. HUMS_1102779]|uniref:hemin-binding protein n=1 Tax=Mycobacterium sp. HUMS_1102779 TaxID=3383487 RepID=UPI00389ABB44
MSRIFDDFERTNLAPASDTESSYRFLNRAARPDWGLVRNLIEDWFTEYPVAAQADLRSRFQDDDNIQHIGAWWELYTYTLFRRLGYQVAIHPVLENTSRQPDFLVIRDGVSMYVECVIFLSGLGPVKGQGSGERSWIFEATNQARDPNFMVDIEIHQSGTQRPKASEIVQPLESWLSSLDPDEVAEQIDAGMGIPALVLRVRGWIIEYGAFPVKPESRGETSRLIGSYPMTGGSINNDTVRYRDLVSRKGGHYGQPDKPLVVAVLNTSGFLEQDEVAEALFGSRAIEYYEGQPESVRAVRRRDGYWRQGPPKRGARVSAVLDGENIYPWRVSAQMPTLWVNPWAERSINATLPFATFTARDTGEVHQTKSGTSAGAVFDLNTDWPGFGR